MHGGQEVRAAHTRARGTHAAPRRLPPVAPSAPLHAPAPNGGLARRHVAQMLRGGSLERLLHEHRATAKEIKNLESGMQQLVYENYSKFISATDTIRDMKTQLDGALPELSQLTATMGAPARAGLGSNWPPQPMARPGSAAGCSARMQAHALLRLAPRMRRCGGCTEHGSGGEAARAAGEHAGAVPDAGAAPAAAGGPWACTRRAHMPNSPHAHRCRAPRTRARRALLLAPCGARCCCCLLLPASGTVHHVAPTAACRRCLPQAVLDLPARMRAAHESGVLESAVEVYAEAAPVLKRFGGRGALRQVATQAEGVAKDIAVVGEGRGGAARGLELCTGSGGVCRG